MTLRASAPSAFADLERQQPSAQLDLVTHGITITLTEDQAEALAGGYVPRVVKSVLRELLDWDLEIQRAADRPAPKGRKAK